MGGQSSHRLSPVQVGERPALVVPNRGSAQESAESPFLFVDGGRYVAGPSDWPSPPESAGAGRWSAARRPGGPAGHRSGRSSAARSRTSGTPAPCARSPHTRRPATPPAPVPSAAPYWTSSGGGGTLRLGLAWLLHGKGQAPGATLTSPRGPLLQPPRYHSAQRLSHFLPRFTTSPSDPRFLLSRANAGQPRFSANSSAFSPASTAGGAARWHRGASPGGTAPGSPAAALRMRCAPQQFLKKGLDMIEAMSYQACGEPGPRANRAFRRLSPGPP